MIFDFEPALQFSMAATETNNSGHFIKCSPFKTAASLSPIPTHNAPPRNHPIAFLSNTMHRCRTAAAPRPLPTCTFCTAPAARDFATFLAFEVKSCEARALQGGCSHGACNDFATFSSFRPKSCEEKVLQRGCSHGACNDFATFLAFEAKSCEARALQRVHSLETGRDFATFLAFEAKSCEARALQGVHSLETGRDFATFLAFWPKSCEVKKEQWRSDLEDRCRPPRPTRRAAHARFTAPCRPRPPRHQRPPPALAASPVPVMPCAEPPQIWIRDSHQDARSFLSTQLFIIDNHCSFDIIIK